MALRPALPALRWRMTAGVVGGTLAAVAVTLALARLLPGSALDRAVLAGVALPLIWLAAMLRALLANRLGRLWLELAAVALAGVLGTLISAWA